MQTRLLESTQRHYDRFPFIEGGSTRVAWWRNYLRDFLPDDLISDQLVLDDGSSVGEISRGLLDRGARVTCLDLSLQSLLRCREINPEAQVFHGTALRLPFADNTFDHAISIGVLHHTPDCRGGFHELARVTSPGGRVVVFLYNFWSIYNVIYHAFAPVRALLPLDRVPSALLHTFQPFVRSHLGQTLTDTELRNLMGDKLWTPQATFHSISEVRRWGGEEGLTLLGTKKFFLGYANVMSFQKQGVGDTTVRREVVVECTSCGAQPVDRKNGSYACSQCSSEYPVVEGIARCLTG